MNRTMSMHCKERLITWADASILVIVFSSMLAVATNSVAQNNSPDAVARVYDNFNERWIDPARWLTGPPDCWGLTLECVRQIRDGKLYLEARNIGWSGGNSDIQGAVSDLFFPAANRITNITADVTVRGASGTNCPLNPQQSGAQVRIGGTFFNSGTGNPADDLSAYVIANHHDQIVDYGIWWGWENQSQWVHLTNIPMGTSVTTTIRWDQQNHRFIAILKTPDGLLVSGTSTYAIADTTPPANPSKSLSAFTYAPNCTVRRTTSEVEANFDNVIIDK